MHVGSLPVSIISRPRQASSASIASDEDDELDDDGSSRGGRYLSDSETDSHEPNSRRPSSDGDDDVVSFEDDAGSRAGQQRRNSSHDGGDEDADESGDRVGTLAPRGSASSSASAAPSGQRALPSHKWPHSLTQSGFWTMATDIDLRSASHRSVHHWNV